MGVGVQDVGDDGVKGPWGSKWQIHDFAGP